MAEVDSRPNDLPCVHTGLLHGNGRADRARTQSTLAQVGTLPIVPAAQSDQENRSRHEHGREHKRVWFIDSNLLSQEQPAAEKAKRLFRKIVETRIGTSRIAL